MSDDFVERIILLLKSNPSKKFSNVDVAIKLRLDRRIVSGVLHSLVHYNDAQIDSDKGKVVYSFAKKK